MLAAPPILTARSNIAMPAITRDSCAKSAKSGVGTNILEADIAYDGIFVTVLVDVLDKVVIWRRRAGC